jgi:DHA1 family inner membrane transport protein
VSSYALGIAIGGPVLTFATMRLPRRLMLRAAFAAYVLGNLLAALSASFGLLVAARVITGSLHGLFIGIALGVAPVLVSPDRMGWAISLVLGGVSVSTALGVPMGTYIGQFLGWQASFLAVVVVGAVALAGIFVLVPDVQTAGATDMRSQTRYALAPRVLAVLLTGLLAMGGQFAALTFLNPFLTQVTGLSESTTALYLLIFGVATSVGTLAVGGRAADRNANLAFLVGTAVVVAAFALLFVGGGSPVLTAVGLVAWGVAGFAVIPSLQYRVVSLAGPGRDLASALPASALTAGIALGSTVAGWGISAFGPRAPVLIAGITGLAVLPLFFATTFLRPPEPERAPQAPPVPEPAEQQ